MRKIGNFFDYIRTIEITTLKEKYLFQNLMM